MTADRTASPLRFPSTHWSAIAMAGGEARRETLERLLQRYVPALRARLFARRSIPADQVDDLLQEFVAKKILEHDLIAQADPHLGKFRTFLLTAFDRFVANSLSKMGTQRRLLPAIPLDRVEPVDGPARHPAARPEAFEIAWAEQTVHEALGRMQQECEAMGRQRIWETFQQRLARPLLEGVEPVPYERLVADLGFDSPIQVSNALVTAKRMYARCLRNVIGEYTDGGEEIETELRELRRILAESAKSAQVGGIYG